MLTLQDHLDRPCLVGHVVLSILHYPFNGAAHVIELVNAEDFI